MHFAAQTVFLCCTSAWTQHKSDKPAPHLIIPFGNEMSLVIDIPDVNFDDANNNNDNNSNLNLNAEPGPESSPGSQLGNM
jgi:hypothetical protein